MFGEDATLKKISSALTAAVAGIAVPLLETRFAYPAPFRRVILTV